MVSKDGLAINFFFFSQIHKEIFSNRILINRDIIFIYNIQFFMSYLFLVVVLQLRVKKVLELRRYKSDEPYPGCQKFLLFGDGNNAYMSHIPTRCKDTQQVNMKHVNIGVFKGNRQI